MSYDLNKINAERRRRGLPPLTMSQASSAASQAPAGTDITPYLVMLMLLASQPSSTSPSYTPDTPAYTAPPPDPAPSPAQSHDSGSSYSSPSYDSGSFGGGSDVGGGSF